MKLINKLAASKNFRKTVFVLGILYIFLTFFIFVEPGPFLRLGNFGVFLFNLIGGPGMLLIPIVSRYFGAFPVALVSSLGMAINDLLSWWVGKYAHSMIPIQTDSKKTKDTIEFLHKYGVYGLFFLALLPTPYDFIGLIAGYLKFEYKNFFLATFIGRLIRFWLIGLGVIGIFGRVL